MQLRQQLRVSDADKLTTPLIHVDMILQQKHSLSKPTIPMVRSSGGSKTLTMSSTGSSTRLNNQLVMGQYFKASATRKMNQIRETNPFTKGEKKSLIVVVDDCLRDESVQSDTMLEIDHERDMRQVPVISMSRSRRSSSPAYSTNSSCGPFQRNSLLSKNQYITFAQYILNTSVADRQFEDIEENSLEPMQTQVLRLATMHRRNDQGKRSCGSLGDEYGHIIRSSGILKGGVTTSRKTPFISQKSSVFLIPNDSGSQSARRLLSGNVNNLERSSSLLKMEMPRKQTESSLVRTNALEKALIVNASLKESIISTKSNQL